MTLIQNGLTWFGARLKIADGRTVTYARGTSTVNLTAVPTMHKYQVFTTEGFETQVTSCDYQITAADLVISGSVIVPRAGDQITESIGGVNQTFEVMNLGEEGTPYDYEAGHDGKLLTVHTKRVS